MQLIGPDKGFRLLRDLAGLRRGEKLRADRRVENVEQHAAQGGTLGRVRLIAHDVAHERLRNARVHAVHAHMVTVVRCPAERQLAQVARADDKAARAVGKVHQLQRTHARLPIFKCDVKHGLALADVGKVAAHRVRNGNFRELYTQLLTQNLCIGARPLRRAEAGHGDGKNVLHGTLQALHGAHGDE